MEHVPCCLTGEIKGEMLVRNLVRKVMRWRREKKMEEREEVVNEEGIGAAEEDAAGGSQFARIIEKLHPRCVLFQLASSTLTMTCTTAYYLEGNAHQFPQNHTRIIQRKVGQRDGHD